MFAKLFKLLRSPTVQKIAVWATPLVLGWVLSKLDKSAHTQSGKPKQSKRRK